jgi:hypothetical protein
MHGLNWYDNDARPYDPVIPRTPTPDPLCEKYYSWSPYSFVLGNPLRNIDPFGMDVWSTSDPEQIARFLNHLQDVVGNKTSDPFDYGGWNHMSDEEYEKQNKDNSVSFNDDTFGFNINLEDYQGSFKAGMRSKKTNYAYITASDLDDLFAPEGEEAGLDLGGNVAGLGLGSAIYGKFGGIIYKNSTFARSLWLHSRIVGNAGHYTSVYSLQLHNKGYGKVPIKRILSITSGRTYAGQLSRLGAGLGYLGAGLAMYESWTIGRKLGYWYGGDALLRSYRQNQYMNRYKPFVVPPK